MSDKVLRTRRIPNEDRLEAIIALLREETLAWRNLAVQGELMDGDTAAANRRLNAAMAATDEAGVLKGDQ